MIYLVVRVVRSLKVPDVAEYPTEHPLNYIHYHFLIELF